MILTIDFRESAAEPEWLERKTQSLFQQLKRIDDVTVERMVDSAPDAGSRSIGRFAWGVLTSEISSDLVRPVLSRIFDVLLGKDKRVIKISAKQAGREVNVEVSNKDDLLVVSQFLRDWGASENAIVPSGAICSLIRPSSDFGITTHSSDLLRSED